MRQSPGVRTDPFSDILRLADAEPLISGGFSAGGAWALRFPRPEKLKFFALTKGECWLSIEGDRQPLRVRQGDVLLLSGRRSFVLASDLSLPPLDALALFANRPDKTIAMGEGDDCVQIGGHVKLDPVSGAVLADVLPPVIHIPGASPQAPVLQWLLSRLTVERGSERPGAAIVCAQLAHLLFVELLRAYTDTASPIAAGALRAVCDVRLGPALQLIHGEPQRNWSLDELARATAMSRTTFATYFKTVAGMPAVTYLTEWRMRLAERALKDEESSLAVLSARLGYGSESAFSNAFKRVVGLSPRQFRANARQGLGPPETVDEAA